MKLLYSIPDTGLGRNGNAPYSGENKFTMQIARLRLLVSGHLKPYPISYHFRIIRDFQLVICLRHAIRVFDAVALDDFPTTVTYLIISVKFIFHGFR